MARLNLSLPGTLGGTYKSNGTYGAPGYAPDYKRLILGDPAYRQTAADLSASNIANDASLTGGLQSAAVQQGGSIDLAQAAKQLGLAPNSPLLAALHSALNPQIQTAAANNPFSTQANADYTHTQQLGQNLANIGARAGEGGMLQTSDLGVADTQANHAYGATNQANLLSYLTGIQHAFDTHAQTQQTNAGQLATAAGQATTRQAALNPVVPGTGAWANITPHQILPGLNIGRGGPSAPTMGSHGAAV